MWWRCSHSCSVYSQQLFGKYFNDTPACDDNAHKAILCTHSNFLWSIPMILLHVMTMLTSLFCVLPETFLREIGHTWNIANDIFLPKFSFLKKKNGEQCHIQLLYVRAEGDKTIVTSAWVILEWQHTVIFRESTRILPLYTNQRLKNGDKIHRSCLTLWRSLHSRHGARRRPTTMQTACAKKKTRQINSNCGPKLVQ